MATCWHWSVSLQWDWDDVPHCCMLSSYKTEWRLISATLCLWRCCFVADQLWFMTRIREEVEVGAVFQTEFFAWSVKGQAYMCIARIQRYICFAAFVGSIGKLYFRNLGGNMSCRYGIAFEGIHFWYFWSSKRFKTDCWRLLECYFSFSGTFSRLSVVKLCHMHL